MRAGAGEAICLQVLHDCSSKGGTGGRRGDKVLKEGVLAGHAPSVGLRILGRQSLLSQTNFDC